MISEHFDIVNIVYDGLDGFVTVVVTFNDAPNRQHSFDIPENDFQADKDWIGDEILRQLRA